MAIPSFKTDRYSNIPTKIPSDIPLDIPSDIPLYIPSDIPLDIPSDIPLDIPLDTYSVRYSVKYSVRYSIRYSVRYCVPDFLHLLGLDLLALVLEALVQCLAGLDHPLELLPVLQQQLLVALHRCQPALLLLLHRIMDFPIG